MFWRCFKIITVGQEQNKSMEEKKKKTQINVHEIRFFTYPSLLGSWGECRVSPGAGRVKDLVPGPNSGNLAVLGFEPDEQPST